MNQRLSWLLAFALLWACPPRARAHYCGPGDMTIRVGQTALYSILAESGEPFHIDALAVSGPDTNVARLDVTSVSDVLNAHFGIIGVAPGTTSITFYWDNPLNGAAGYCTVSITVPGAVAAKTSANAPYSPSSDEPVNTATGEFYFAKPPDLYLAGPRPMFFQRYYASRLQVEGLSTTAMGNNWRHNFQFHLGFSGDGSNAVVEDNRGRTLCFQKQNNAWVLVTPLFVPYQLTTSGGNYLLGDPLSGLLYLFDPAGDLLSISDRRGNTQTLSYSGGALARVDDNMGRFLQFAYDSDGYLASVTDGSRAVSFTYDTFTLASVTDARGNKTSYLYDTNNSIPGLMVRETLPLGNARFTQTYDDSGRVILQTDALGNIWRFSYEILLSVITNPVGQSVRYAWDTNGNMTAYTDENGRTMAVGHDSAGRRVSSTDRLGKTTTVSFDGASSRLASRTDANGATTTFSYAASTTDGVVFQDLVKISYPDGNSQYLTNDSNGSLVALRDRAGNLQKYTLNNRGQVFEALNTAGGVTKYAYYGDGSLAGITSPAGDITTFGYDAMKRIVGATNADGTSRQFTYDANDNLTSVTDERGKTTRSTYDANGNLTSVTDALGNITRLGYDALDRLLSVTDPDGNASRRTYDPLGRAATLTDRNGNTGSLAYDGPGRLLSVTDAAGGVWRRAYDAEGNISSETDPLRNLRSYARDAVGRVLQITNPSSSLTSIAYDTLGRQQLLRDPVGNTTRFSYDPRSLLSGVALGGGASASLSRDAYGRVGQVTDPNGQGWPMVHDTQGRLIVAADPLGRQTGFAYDPLNRPASVTFPGALGTEALSYDATGNLLSEQYSDGTAQSYSYDDDGRLLTATGVSLAYDAAGNITSNNGLAIGRDAGGRMTSVTLAPGKSVMYTWDARNLVTGVDDWSGGHTTLAYDAAQRLVSVSRPNGIKTLFGYSPDGFLVSVQETTNGASFAGAVVTRDAKGRITASARNYPADKPAPSNSARSRYDAASQVAGYNYDAMGRLRSDGKRSYSWNLASRLTGYTESGASAVFTYDAFGLMLGRSSGGVNQQFVWNYAGGIPSLVVVREGGGDLRYYVRTPDGALLYSMEAASNQRHFYHFDEVGNTTLLTDDSGHITDTYSFTPYGIPVASTGFTDNLFTFGGAYGMMREGGTGLYYSRSRYYDAGSARFISRDRMLRSLSPNEINPYSFNRQNPLSYADAWGHDARINRDGPDAVHTDFSVDVWAGDRIIGVLTISFARQGWSGKSGFTKFFEMFALATTGAQGEFTAFFTAGASIADSPVYPGCVVVKGTREQDERTAAEMMKVAGIANYMNTPGLFFQRLLRSERAEDGGKRANFNLKPPLPTGDWDTYRFENRTCNTFTSAMLNTYFGRDVGTCVLADSVMENLKKLQSPPASEDEFDYGPMYVPF